MTERENINVRWEYILRNLPETKKHELHNKDAAVRSFIELLARTDNYNEVFGVIDQMFIHYTKVVNSYSDELLHMRQRLTPADIARLSEYGMKS